ncbi:Na+/H+ antiporter NhaC family protein [Aliidiomarina haloalkalitolerans]|uniref:Sodium:proton antiporter n=1 Tax=Aliidiomarina haloalkalitolerans TaxID=859059 RepID=A0A432VQ10_9GAMM|nr:Na+/H+ antiporter NhaC family protein [Aliidiomarina haloalkalitolerans]MCL5255265.1 sodium:proton antiporter [Gammaproteobacteria bacterium]RUO18255.1 sodium:proton antiporter [Aliidiomarina haloalkalitolerans]
MSSELGWLSLLPSLLAIVFAILTRRVILALLGGVVLAYLILFMPSAVSGLYAAVAGLGETLIKPSNQLIWGFTLAIGALFGVLERAGTFKHFVAALERKQIVPNRRRARMFTWMLGVVVFIESNVSIMTAGTTSRPVYDKLGVSRQKLAYIIDSTCAPVCILIPLNAWGAFNLGLIGNQGVEDPLMTFVYSLGLNFYAIIALLMALFVAWTGWAFGPMKAFEAAAQERARKAELNARVEQIEAGQSEFPINRGAVATVIISLVTMVLMVPVMLWYTGDGSIVRGSGMQSVFVAIVTALVIAVIGSILTLKAPIMLIIDSMARGAWKILPLAVILWLAIALGDVTRAMGSGEYLAGILNETLPMWTLPALIFLLSALTAFAIGSSWGTFAIMLPLAIPLAMTLGLPIPLFIAAALAGGIFGDHSSPISDTTIIASLASGSDHIDHVRTQLPYALLAALFATIGYLVAGWLVAI